MSARAMRAIGALLLLVGLIGQPAFAQSGAIGSIAKAAYANAAQAAASSAPRLVPVATGTHYPFQKSSNAYAAGMQMSFISRHYFPHGGKNIRLVFASSPAGAQEVSTATGFPLKIEVSISPPPWDASKTYQPGDVVVGYETIYNAAGAFGPSPYYLAATANTGSRPSASNAAWTMLTDFPNKRFPVTVDAVQDASFGTQTVQAGSVLAGTGGASSTTLTVSSASVSDGLQVGDQLAGATIAAFGTGTGSTGTYTLSQAVTLATGTTLSVTRQTAKGIVVTDPIPIQVPVGSWLEIESWLPMNGVQITALEPQSQNPALGPMANVGAAVPDATTASLGSSGLGTGSYGTIHLRPAAIIGVPLTPIKTVAIIADSIGAGQIGGNAVGGLSISSGGSGYRVGDILTPSLNGATAGAIAAGSAPKIIVDHVDGNGAITGVHGIEGGGFTNTVSQSGQTLPSGVQTLSGGSGSGATGTLTFITNVFDVGDLLGGQGYIERALDAAGVPYCAFSSPGDRANLWIARSYARIRALATCNPDVGIIGLLRNDATGGDSAAVMQANLVSMQAIARSTVARVYVMTVTPETTSTTANGASTLADQIVTSNDQARQTLNASLRANWKALGFDGLIDVAALVENGGAVAPTGKWDPITVNGVPMPCAADGKHPGPACIQKMIPAVSAAIPAMISFADLPRAANDNDGAERRAA